MDRAGAKGGCSDKCQFLVNSYEDLHYDVLNIARQEVSMGYETLVALRDTAKSTDYVSANLVDAKSNKPIFDPYVIKDYGNMRIGVIGLLRDADFPATSSIVDTTLMRVTPTMDAVNKYLPELMRKSDAVLVLCELPTDDIDTLVAKYPDIDLIISTGALRTGETTQTVGKKTRLLGTGSSGYNGHYALLEFQPAWGDSIAFTDFKDALLETYDVPGTWSERLAAFEGKTAPVTPAQKNLNTTPGQSLENTPSNSQTKSSAPGHEGHDHG